MHAELDRATYPLGLAISKAQLKSLPIEPHAERGAWNYTVQPRQETVEAPATGTAAAERRRILDLLADPSLTGMNREHLATLATKLTPQLGALREERLHRLRGGPRRKATADHKLPLLSPADKVLLTILYLRHVCSQTMLADMLGLNQRTLGQPIKHIRRLLQEHGVIVTPTTLCFANGWGPFAELSK